jgi:hypothetical protein
MITFGSWVAVDNERLLLLANTERKRMSMPWRLWELALARMNNYGHAPFRKDEIVRLACGEVSRSNTQAVRRGMVTLASMGRIAPVGDNGSTLFCVMVNPEVAQRRAGKGSYKFLCSEISHMSIRQSPYDPAWVIRPPAGPVEVDDGPDDYREWRRQSPGESGSGSARPWNE